MTRPRTTLIKAKVPACVPVAPIARAKSPIPMVHKTLYTTVFETVLSVDSITFTIISPMVK
jgi:hypothetical protein